MKTNKTNVEVEKNNKHKPKPDFVKNIRDEAVVMELIATDERLKHADDELKSHDVLLAGEKGFLSECLTQEEILAEIDVSSQTKRFDAALEYGPYFVDFSRNGRYMLIGGRRGQLAMTDWKARELLYDINVKEQIRAVHFLHKETFMAVSQKDYTFVYDNEGKEIHCVRQIYRAKYFEYLPYHALLIAGTEKGFIHYLDVSMGSMIATIPTYLGEINMMCQNPTNGIISTGHGCGTVSMWSPNEKTAVMKMLCHQTPLRTIAIDHTGSYLVTSGQDRKMKVWDLRTTNKELADIRLPDGPKCMEFSQQNLLAVSTDNTVFVLKDIHHGCHSFAFDNKESIAEFADEMKHSKKIRNVRPYLMHSFTSAVNDLHYCPYEDILLCGLYKGFSTIFVPGSGEPNFDAFEANPYATKQSRNEMEVKQMLEKIPSELISMTSNLTQVYEPSIEETWEEKRRKFYGEDRKLDVKKNRSYSRKGTTMKAVSTKDSLHFERIKLQQGIRSFVSKQGVKRKTQKTPTGSVLDNLLYKE